MRFTYRELLSCPHSLKGHKWGEKDVVEEADEAKAVKLETMRILLDRDRRVYRPEGMVARVKVAAAAAVTAARSSVVS